MLFSSIADLPYFEQYHEDVEKIIADLENDNNFDTNNNTNRSTLSILEQSKGGLRFYKDEQNENEEVEENKVEGQDIKVQNDKKKCNC